MHPQFFTAMPLHNFSFPGDERKTKSNVFEITLFKRFKEKEINTIKEVKKCLKFSISMEIKQNSLIRNIFTMAFIFIIKVHRA